MAIAPEAFAQNFGIAVADMATAAAGVVALSPDTQAVAHTLEALWEVLYQEEDAAAFLVPAALVAAVEMAYWG